MRKSKIYVENSTLDKIVASCKINEVEKIRFLKYLWYLTKREREDLLRYV